jgi:hypothetical protein
VPGVSPASIFLLIEFGAQAILSLAMFTSIGFIIEILILQLAAAGLLFKNLLFDLAGATPELLHTNEVAEPSLPVEIPH